MLKPKTELCEKLEDLIIEMGEKYPNKYLSEVVGIEKNKVTRLFNGDYKNLKYDEIISLAKHFNVSSDYLLGLTEVPNANFDIRKISERLGINANFIELLDKENKGYNFINETINDFFTNRLNVFMLFESLNKYLYNFNYLHLDDEKLDYKYYQLDDKTCLTIDDINVMYERRIINDLSNLRKYTKKNLDSIRIEKNKLDEYISKFNETNNNEIANILENMKLDSIKMRRDKLIEEIESVEKIYMIDD